MKTEVFNNEVNLFKTEIERMIRTAFRKEGRIEPTAFAYKHVEDSKEQPIAVMGGFGPIMSMPNGRDMVKNAIKDMVKKVEPIALAFVMEANATIMELKDGESMKEMTQRYIDNKDSMPKESCIIIAIETYCMEYTIRYVIKDRENFIIERSDDGEEWKHKDSNNPGTMRNFLTECYADFDENADLSKLN